MKQIDLKITDWEITHNFILPINYRSFIAKQNVDLGNRRLFSVNGLKGEFGLDTFFSFHNKTDTDSIDYAIRIFKDIFNLHYLPIGRESSGGLILIDDSDKVYFWHHETSICKSSFKYIANTVQDFINLLKPEEPISFGKNIDLVDNGSDEQILKFINSGYDLNKPLEINQTILQRAALLSKNWLIEELIGRGANLDGALERCLIHNNLKGFELLLQAGANPNEMSNSKYPSPVLYKIVVAGNLSFLEKLLEFSPDLNWKHPSTGRDVLEVAKFKKNKGVNGMDEIIELLNTKIHQ